MIRSLLAISMGASVGAVLRWALGNAFNALFPLVPPGTWLANLLGGYLMGIALAFFGQHTGLSAEWRLIIVTGFLGGLTTSQRSQQKSPHRSSKTAGCGPAPLFLRTFWARWP